MKNEEFKTSKYNETMARYPTVSVKALDLAED